MTKLYTILITMALLTSCNSNKEEPPELEFLTVRIERELDNLYGILNDFCSDYNYSADSSYLVEHLTELYHSKRHARAASYVNAEGALLYSFPTMSNVYGVDISYQEHMQYMMRTKEPVLSKQFRTVQGFNAVTIGHPIVADDTLHSIFSLLISPQYMVEDIVDDYPYLDSCEVWVIEQDGTIIYDMHIEEIGNNVLKDREYCLINGFKELVDSIMSHDHGFHVYAPQNNIEQNVAWETIEFLNTKWTIVIEYPRGHKIMNRTAAVLGIPSPQEALINLSENQLFLDFVHASDDRGAEEMMKDFYDHCSGMFAVQWVDTLGQNRIGFPQHNMNYLGHKLHTKCKDLNILNAIKNKTIYNYDEYLSEDYFVSYYTVPLYRNKQYLGLLYYTNLRPM